MSSLSCSASALSSKRAGALILPVAAGLLLGLVVGFFADDIAGTPRAVVEGAPIIIDGDTLHIQVPDGLIKIRLREIVAPDRGDEFHTQATARLSELAGNWVVCRLTGAAAWNRIAAYCEAGGRDLGMAMVRDGFAEQDRRFGDSYIEAEREAREAKRGMWVPE